ncbi:PAS domain S-box-containing protein/diguanylate cyclase (GGDEF) domain-containing protein [Roseospirillum parvum]|uniref:diguanylate cyclase n=2 Tax=Roseospirillum parvum TaxID=83401 RepID=A0A1G7XVM2_9PROT|nr:PAS domain S-box-containing protein/diguanylate cyclase (GGDEF) domain-containing protein [Roseospirillum parvum]
MVTVTAAGSLIALRGGRVIGQAEQAWSTVAEHTDRKLILYADIRAAFGYGGFIHAFKNLILRGDLMYYFTAAHHMHRLDQNIHLYRALPLTEAETAALDTLESTVERYRGMLDVAYDQTRAGTLGTLLDPLVTVDDAAAVAALDDLARVIAGEMAATRISVGRTLTLGQRLFGSLPWLIPLSLIAVVLTGALVLRLNRVVRQAERQSAELADSEQRLMTVIEGSIQGLLIHDGDLRPLFVNRSLARMYGYESAAELLAEPTLEHLIAPGQRDQARQARQSLLNGEVDELSLRLETSKRSGDLVIIDAAVRLVPWNGAWAVQATMIDVTAQELHHQELESSRATMEAHATELAGLADSLELARLEAEAQRQFQHRLLDTLPSPVFYQDPDGRLKLVNQAFEEAFLGDAINQPGELGERRLVDLLSDDLKTVAIKTDCRLIAAGDDRVVSFGGETLFADGQMHHVVVRQALVRDAFGTPCGIIGVISDITGQKRLENELRRMATTDFLTGACNRRRFLEIAGLEIERARRHGRPLSVLTMDIDHFKQINDTHGHATGDLALKAFVAACEETLRGGDALGRMGGEEFAALLPETDAAGALVLGERLRAAVSRIDLRGADRRPVPMTVSIGQATLNPAEPNLDALLAEADRALYRAKQDGRDRVVGALAS